MKNDLDKIKDKITYVQISVFFIYVLLLVIIGLLSSCQKETYCIECTNQVQHTTWCGVTIEEMNEIIEFWESEQGDWECQVKGGE